MNAECATCQASLLPWRGRGRPPTYCANCSAERKRKRTERTNGQRQRVVLAERPCVDCGAGLVRAESQRGRIKLRCSACEPAHRRAQYRASWHRRKAKLQAATPPAPPPTTEACYQARVCTDCSEAYVPPPKDSRSLRCAACQHAHALAGQRSARRQAARRSPPESIVQIEARERRERAARIAARRAENTAKMLAAMRARGAQT